jgi:hypothetical protein
LKALSTKEMPMIPMIQIHRHSAERITELENGMLKINKQRGEIIGEVGLRQRLDVGGGEGGGVGATHSGSVEPKKK